MILNSSNPYYNSILGKIEQVCSVMQIMQIAYVTGFIKRTRDFRPEMLLLAMFLMLDRSRSISFEAMFTAYSEACIKFKYRLISHQAFLKQVNKEQFEAFAHQLFTKIAEACRGNELSDGADLFLVLLELLPWLKDIFISDGSELRLVDGAASAYNQGDTCKGPAGTCQKKVHGFYSARSQSLVDVSITKGTGAERPEVPVEKLAFCLWLADAGYIDFDIFKEIAESHGCYVVRGRQDMNPMVRSITTYSPEGEIIKHEELSEPTPLKELAPTLDNKCSYDMQVTLRNDHECRVIRSYVPDCDSSNRSAKAKRRNEHKDGFAYFYTNLSPEQFDLHQIIALYRVRWSIEIFWKVQKSFNGLKAERLLKNSVIHALIKLSLACQALKTLVAQMVEPLLGGKRLSLLQVAAHTGTVVMETLEHVLGKCCNFEMLDISARKLMWNFSRRVKRIPSKVNREKGKGVYCSIKELKRPAKTVAGLLRTSSPPCAA